MIGRVGREPFHLDLDRQKIGIGLGDLSGELGPRASGAGAIHFRLGSRNGFADFSELRGNAVVKVENRPVLCGWDGKYRYAYRVTSSTGNTVLWTPCDGALESWYPKMQKGSRR